MTHSIPRLSAVIMCLCFLLTVGTVGALDCNTISLPQGIIQTGIFVVIGLTVGYKSKIII